MKILACARKFVDLSQSRRNAAQKKEYSDLRRKLAHYGLDPKHTDGLIQRAIVFDNQKLVQDYIEAAKRAEHADKVTEKAQSALDGMIARLRQLGIENINRRSLQTTLNEIKANAKANDRLVRAKATRAPHKVLPATDEEVYDDADDEFDEEDDVFAVPIEATAI